MHAVSGETIHHHLVVTEFRKIESLVNRRLETFIIGNPDRIINLEEYLEWVRPKLVKLFVECRLEFPRRFRLRPPQSPPIVPLWVRSNYDGYYWWRLDAPRQKKNPASATLYHSFKINMVLDVQFCRDVSSSTDLSVRRFKTPNTPLYQGTNVNSFVETAIRKLITEKNDCTAIGSGWTILAPISMEVRKHVYSPFKSDNIFNQNCSSNQ